MRGAFLSQAALALLGVGKVLRVELEGETFAGEVIFSSMSLAPKAQRIVGKTWLPRDLQAIAIVGKTQITRRSPAAGVGWISKIRLPGRLTMRRGR